MSHIIKSVRAEILRLAEKEAKAQVAKAHKAASQYRKQVAELKRLLAQREKEIKQLKRQVPAEPLEDDPLADVRFSARSVRAQRRRLGFSAEDYGRLVGVSALTIYHWERKVSRPRRSQLARLVAVRGIGKREALVKLAEREAKKKKRR